MCLYKYSFSPENPSNIVHCHNFLTTFEPIHEIQSGMYECVKEQEIFQTKEYYNFYIFIMKVNMEVSTFVKFLKERCSNHKNFKITNSLVVTMKSMVSANLLCALCETHDLSHHYVFKPRLL